MNLKVNWVLQIDPSIQKTLKKIPTNYAKRILATIESLPANPYSGDIQKMKDEPNVWRRRLGEYRLFYEILQEKSVIHIFRIERRTTATY